MRWPTRWRFCTATRTFRSSSPRCGWPLLSRDDLRDDRARNEDRWDRSNAVVEDDVVVLYDKRPEARTTRMAWIDYGLTILSRDVVEDIPRLRRRSRRCLPAAQRPEGSPRSRRRRASTKPARPVASPSSSAISNARTRPRELPVSGRAALGSSHPCLRPLLVGGGGLGRCDGLLGVAVDRGRSRASSLRDVPRPSRVRPAPVAARERPRALLDSHLATAARRPLPARGRAAHAAVRLDLGVPALLTAQSVALALTAPALYALARAYGAPPPLAAVPAFLWLVCPWVASVNLFEFVPIRSRRR